MISAVFDCNVLVQAIGKGGNHAYGCLKLVEFGAIKLYESHACLNELNEVLKRTEIRAIFPLLDDERVERIGAWLRDNSELIDPVPELFKYPRDPLDEPYINLAIAAKADYLVSWDKDVLSLANSNSLEGKRLAELAESLSVVDPKEFLLRLHSTQGRRVP